MNRLLAAIVPVVAVALLAVALVAAQEGTPEPDEVSVGIITNELGTPCASPEVSPEASPVGSPVASPDASPDASPAVIVLPGCITEGATPDAT